MATTIFTRSKKNPILKPDPDNPWENLKLYNPGAVLRDRKYHLFYRAVNRGEDWSSSIGYAVSEDGEYFTRFEQPILRGESDYEKRGLEDPRITQIDRKYYMAYAAYDGATPRLCVATSVDLKEWKKYGPVFSDWNFAKAGGVYITFKTGKPEIKPMEKEWSKSGGLFSEKIDNKFLMLFGEHRIWVAESENGINWDGDHKPFLEPREGNFFDNTFVEMGPPPIRTDKGWLVLYHGIDDRHRYSIGLLLLDFNDPRRILYRSDEPVFCPSAPYEMSGLVDVLPGGLDSLQKMSDAEQAAFLKKMEAEGKMPQVVFCCGAVVVDGVLRIFYGAGDSVICTATAQLDRLLGLIKD